MLKQKIGYDFDGVLCTEQKGWFNDLMWKLFPKWWAIQVHKRAQYTGIVPESGSIIITGRMGGECWFTEEQLRKWNIKESFLFIDIVKDSPDKQASIVFKKDTIRQLHISIFHENDDETIKELEKTFKGELTIIKH